MLMMDIHRDAIHGGGVGEVRDDGVGGAVQDEGTLLHVGVPRADLGLDTDSC